MFLCLYSLKFFFRARLSRDFEPISFLFVSDQKKKQYGTNLYITNYFNRHNLIFFFFFGMFKTLGFSCARVCVCVCLYFSSVSPPPPPYLIFNFYIYKSIIIFLLSIKKNKNYF